VVNPRSLGPAQLAVLLAMGRLGHATGADIITAANFGDDALAAQALRFLVNRGLAETGSFGGSIYGYRLTDDGKATAQRARPAA
jgi:hypothetical protein